MLYHINVGEPLLGAGSCVEASLAELAPKDERSANEIDHWNQMSAPESKYAERVYFGRMHNGNSQGEAAAMLVSAKRDLGLGVSFDTLTLPYFVLWKNTAAREDGYVIGLEPATNLPNRRSFEAEQGRVVTIGPNETVPFRVALHPLMDRSSVETYSKHIAALSAQGPCVTRREPKPGWSML
jgi:hypothetical protein